MTNTEIIVNEELNQRQFFFHALRLQKPAHMTSPGPLVVFFIFVIVNKLHHFCAECCKDGDLRVLSAAS